MYIAWVGLVIGLLVSVAAIAAIVVVARGLGPAAQLTPALPVIRVAGIIVAIIGILVAWNSTGLGGAHRPLDEDTVRTVGRAYFDENLYAHGSVYKNGFDEWQHFVDPDYAHARREVSDNSSGTYCIDVTRESGGQYGEDGHSTGYQPTASHRESICIPITWNGDADRFEAHEPAVN